MVFALGVLLVSMASGQSGIANYIELKKNRDDLHNVVREIAIENQNLESEIQKLRTSREAQVHHIKQQYGYVEKGEYVYHFQAENGRKKGRRQASEEIAASRRKPRI